MDLLIISILLTVGMLVFGFLYTFLPTYFQYKRSSYKDINNVSLWKVYLDKGYRGEFLTYIKLEKFKDGKILCNVYLPKSKNEEETTEVDVIFLHKTGIYVLESKNYSGKVYGKEKSKEWHTYINKQKYSHFNPIWQNKGHITALSKFLSLDISNFVSLIVYSERCELKKVEYTETDKLKVIQRFNLTNTMKFYIKNNKEIFTEEELNDLYENLKKETNVSQEIKEKHIENINKNK